MGKKSKFRKMAARFGMVKQVAALPYRIRDEGIEFLVITSRRRKRLIVPKGWPMRGKPDAAAAAIEADEEAGVKGRVKSDPLGSFEYVKDIGSDAVRVTTAVFPLRVKKIKADWKERTERKRKWLSAEDAAAQLFDDGLAGIVRYYATSVRRPKV
jgi:8-oxo-dGTP pyrophosphatase MutT (NUDIX family)